MPALSYRSPKTEVRASAIQGKGLFATRKILAGEIVCVKGGYVFTRQAWAELERTLGPAEIQIAEDLFIAPSNDDERDGSMIYSNHSCEPNIGVQGSIVFVAMRDVDAGEELTHDWATTDDLDYVMDCNCRHPSCRDVITGKDWEKPELQERYAGWFSWFLERKIQGSRD